ncbi:protein FAR1-RELATED SEQUENCE 5-like [Trifolium pratense]|uniref:protein FAR1-RELATED SEQUENCE 5-like n=1 Tax=Trifolium pratense TaxID=57577 RepID=UPI001E69528C|nr:protein FAR1-RELATED SEQUENCE 5-like [Trifolium pratense]
MSTYSEEMLHLDSDIEGEEFTSGDGVGTDRDDLGKENCKGQKCLSEIIVDDIRAMEFSTEQEAIDFYEAYARSQGFAIRKDDVKYNDENEIVSRRLLCNKAGKSERKNRKNEDRHRPTMRIGCLARLRVAYDMIRKIWKVTMFQPFHNHDLTPANFVHLIPNYRKLSEADKQVVNGLHSQGVRTCHILGFLMDQKGGHEDLGFIKKDLYNYTDHQGRVRIEDEDTFATLSYFQGKADGDSNFFSEFTFTDDGRLENIFWADSTSKLDYECFGDVVAFDTTYKKNRYGKPLVIFSGYNHHGETTIFVCALICDETAETYKWVLNMFSKAMYNKYPKAVVTYADKAMREAIRVKSLSLSGRGLLRLMVYQRISGSSKHIN